MGADGVYGSLEGVAEVVRGFGILLDSVPLRSLFLQGCSGFSQC